MKKAYILAVFFSFLMAQISYASSWIDNWMSNATQQTASSPNYFKSQKRGFASLGSFSMRWPVSNDYLMNISPPTFKSGCGGIDLFLGGGNFMQPKYLVQKLQGMINAAPAIAFDLALQVVSQQLSNSLGKFEAIIDRLNGLQLNDCKASKAIIANVAGDLTNNMAIQNYKTTATNDFLESSGWNNLSYAIKQLGDSSGTSDMTIKNATGASPSAMVSGCPAALKNVFFQPNSSLINNVLKLKGLSAANAAVYSELMRGYIGDIYIDSTGTNYSYVPGCPEDSPDHIEGLVDGQIYIRPLNAGVLPPQACTRINSVTINGITYANVQMWVMTMLQGITQNIISRTSMSAPQMAFIQIIPLPLYQSIITQVKSQGNLANASDIAAEYTPVVSASYAYAIMIDMLDQISTAIETSKTVTANSQGATNAGNQNHCHLAIAQPAIKQLQEMKNHLNTYTVAARSQLAVKLQELNTYQQYNAANINAGKIIDTAISQFFPNH